MEIVEELKEQEVPDQPIQQVDAQIDDLSKSDHSSKNYIEPEQNVVATSLADNEVQNVTTSKGPVKKEVVISKDEIKYIQKSFGIKTKSDSLSELSDAFCTLLKINDIDKLAAMKKVIDITSRNTSMLSITGLTYQKLMEDKNLFILKDCFNESIKYQSHSQFFCDINEDTIQSVQFLKYAKDYYNEQYFKDLKVPSLNKILFNIPKELKQVTFYICSIHGVKNLSFVSFKQLDTTIHEHFESFKTIVPNMIQPPQAIKQLVNKLLKQDYEISLLERVIPLIETEYRQSGFLIELLESYKTKVFDNIVAPQINSLPIAFQGLWEVDNRVIQINQAMIILNLSFPLTLAELGQCVDFVVQNFYTIDNFGVEAVTSTRLFREFKPTLQAITQKQFENKFSEIISSLNIIQEQLGKDRLVLFANCLNIIKSAEELQKLCQRLQQDFDVLIIWELIWDDYQQIKDFLGQPCNIDTNVIKYLNEGLPMDKNLFSYVEFSNLAISQPAHYLFLLSAMQIANTELSNQQQQLIVQPICFQEVQYLKQIGDQSFKYLQSNQLAVLLLQNKLIENHKHFLETVVGAVKYSSFVDKLSAINKFYEFSKAEDKNNDLEYLNQIFPILQDLSNLENYLSSPENFTWQSVFSDSVSILEFINSKMTYNTQIEPYEKFIKLLSEKTSDQIPKNFRMYPFDSCQNVPKNQLQNIFKMAKIANFHFPLSFSNLQKILKNFHSRANKLLSQEFKKIVFDLNIFQNHLPFLQELTNQDDFLSFKSKFLALEAVYNFVGERCIADFSELFDYIQSSDGLLAYCRKLENVDKAVLFNSVVHQYHMIKDTLPLIENNIYNDLKSYFDDFDANQQMFLFKLKVPKKVLQQLQMAQTFFNNRSEKKILNPITYDEMKTLEKVIDLIFNKISSRISKKQLKEKLGTSMVAPDFSSIVEAYCALSDMDLDRKASEKQINTFVQFSEQVNALQLNGKQCDNEAARFQKLEQKQANYVYAYTMYHNIEYPNDKMILPLNNGRLAMLAKQIQQLYELEQLAMAKGFQLVYKSIASTEEERVHYNIALLKKVGNNAKQCQQYLNDNQQFVSENNINLSQLQFQSLLELQIAVVSMFYQQDSQLFLQQYLKLLPAEIIGQLVDLLVASKIHEPTTPLVTILSNIQCLITKLGQYQIYLDSRTKEGKSKIVALLTLPDDEIQNILYDDIQQRDSSQRSLLDKQQQLNVNQQQEQSQPVSNTFPSANQATVVDETTEVVQSNQQIAELPQVNQEVDYQQEQQQQSINYQQYDTYGQQYNDQQYVEGQYNQQYDQQYQDQYQYQGYDPYQ